MFQGYVPWIACSVKGNFSPSRFSAQAGVPLVCPLQVDDDDAESGSDAEADSGSDDEPQAVQGKKKGKQDKKQPKKKRRSTRRLCASYAKAQYRLTDNDLKQLTDVEYRDNPHYSGKD